MTDSLTARYMDKHASIAYHPALFQILMNVPVFPALMAEPVQMELMSLSVNVNLQGSEYTANEVK